MTISKFFLSLCLTLLGTMFLPSNLRADPIARPLSVTDVSLTAQSVLEGRLLDPFGNVLGNTRITLRQQRKLIWSGRTDAEGRFQVPGLTCGVYRMEGDRITAICRIWTQQAAPPQADQSLLLTRDLTSGQDRFDPRSFENPIRSIGLANMSLPSLSSKDIRSLMSP